MTNLKIYRRLIFLIPFFRKSLVKNKMSWWMIRIRLKSPFRRSIKLWAQSPSWPPEKGGWAEFSWRTSHLRSRTCWMGKRANINLKGSTAYQFCTIRTQFMFKMLFSKPMINFLLTCKKTLRRVPKKILIIGTPQFWTTIPWGQKKTYSLVVSWAHKGKI